MPEPTRPPGPVAFLYARLSSEESEQTCVKCLEKWNHTAGTIAVCPKCGHKSKVEHPHSIERQTDRMLHWCKAKWSEEEMPTLVVVKELGTGFKAFAGRPEGRAIIGNMRKGDFLVVCKLDRGWRNSYDFHATVNTMESVGVTLMVVEEQYDTSTAMGRFLVTLSVGLAQLERDRCSERKKASIAWHKERGLCSGNHTKFGSMVTICQKTGKKIVVDNPDELRMAKWIYQMRYVNHVPWDKIGIAANELGFVNRAGRPFTYNKLKLLGTYSRVLHASGKLDKIS